MVALFTSQSESALPLRIIPGRKLDRTENEIGEILWSKLCPKGQNSNTRQNWGFEKQNLELHKIYGFLDKKESEPNIILKLRNLKIEEHSSFFQLLVKFRNFKIIIYTN